MALMGIDYGTRRVGLAVSDSEVLATPHSVLRNEGDVERVLEQIALLGELLEVTTYVLGVPRRRGHGDAATVQRFESLAERLRQRSCKQVVLWDESLTTVEAHQKAADRGARGKKLKDQIDMHAAAIILQSYLDAADRRTS